MSLFYEYFASGIAESGIRQFGGEQCYNQFPPLYHWIVSISLGLISIIIIWSWRHILGTKHPQKQRSDWNWIQKLGFAAGLLSFLLTFYYKVITKRGFFILNPCHISLLFLLILLMAKDSTSFLMRSIYTSWTAWLFGTFAALIFQHLQDISMFEVVLYYVQHLVIFPIGPLLLYRRYGNIFPSFKNQIASYASFLVHHCLILTPISRMFKVNLNFSLCHSPYQFFFQDFGYHYFLIESFNICLISYLIRIVSYLFIEGCVGAHRFIDWIVITFLGIRRKEQ